MSDIHSHVIKALHESQIIPDVVPESFTKPEAHIHAVWATPEGYIQTEEGNAMPREGVLEEPEIKLKPGHSLDIDASYTIVMTDPDAPSRDDPKFGQWRHWVQPGLKIISGKEEGFLKKEKNALTPWFPPGPPPGTGFHRYIFLLYQEPSGGLQVPQDGVEHQGEFTSRRKWNATAFAEKYGLKLVGTNFFLTKATE